MYPFRCRRCGQATQVFALMSGETPTDPGIACECGRAADWQRLYGLGVAVQRPMQEHFDYSIGKVVSDRRQVDSELRRLSAEATERTGIVHNFERVDSLKPEAVGATSEGLHEQAKGRRDRGLKDLKVPT